MAAVEAKEKDHAAPAGESNIRKLMPSTKVPAPRKKKQSVQGMTDTSELPEGKFITDRWKIIRKLGEGGGGAVYKVQDAKHPSVFRACKVENESEAEEGVLKLEYEILAQLQHTFSAVYLVTAGRLPEFRFIVIQLLDKDLYALKRSLQEPFSEGSMFKLGILSLYAIKQLHELGYVHRDVKPGNLMLGKTGKERRTVYLIDYGMVRSFAKKKGAAWKLRAEREQGKVVFRGTLRYCSMNVHMRKEQCRADDLWALLYAMTELFYRLPWNRENDEEKIIQAKKTLPDSQVFQHCPQEFLDFRDYLKTLKFEDRPDYYKVYKMMWKGMKRFGFQFTTPFEWEEPDLETCLETMEADRKAKKPCSEYLKISGLNLPAFSSSRGMPCVLSSTLSTALHEAYLKEASLPHPTRGDMEEVTTLAQPEAFKKYLDEVAGTSCSPDTDTNGSEHGQENGNGVSSEILNSVENDESSNHSSGSRRRKALRRQREEDEPSQRKSTRRAGDVVETNYVDSLDLKQPRSVQPPTGTTRVPFNSPKQGAEDKQMERLRINMVGPRTRETGTTTVDAADKVRRRVIGINEGSDYQASVVPIEEFRMPTKAEMDAYPDRDDESVNIMWRDKPSLDAQLLEEAWVAIRKQSAGMIPIDAMLHRLLLCNYNVDKMLQTIELEHQNLPQPFEQLSVGQRKEYERWLRKTGNASAKKFRMMQDKFMKTYWLGEIVNYYYSTKKKGCPTVEYNLCTCRSQCDVEDRGRVTRVECSNCTQYIWGEKRRVPNKLCAVCYLYQRRNNEPRRCPKLTEDEEKIASFWKEMDEIGSRHRTLSQVLEKMEKERKDLYVENARLNPEECPVVSGKKTSRLTPEDMADLAAKYRVAPQQNCVILSPQMSTIRAASLVKFTPQETMKTVEGLLKYGKKWATVACHVGTKEAVEVEYFYKANCRKYRLDVLTNPNAPPASPLSAKDKEKEKERSGTPESRKRKTDVDPPYKGDAGVTPQKTSRKTRRSGVGGSERTPPIEMNHSQPVEAL